MYGLGGMSGVKSAVLLYVANLGNIFLHRVFYSRCCRSDDPTIFEQRRITQ